MAMDFLKPFEDFVNHLGETVDEGAIRSASWIVEHMPAPQQAKDVLAELMPFVLGRSAWPFPTQWTSWQYFTGSVDASQTALQQLVDLIGITLQAEDGYFYVQSARHPNDLYKCEFSMARVGGSEGLRVSRILRFVTRLLKKVRGATWLVHAAAALRKAIVLYAKHSRSINRLVEHAPKPVKDKVDETIKSVNGVLEGWGGQGPLQNFRRSVFNAQASKNEDGPPTGLFGPIVIMDVGVTLAAQARLILMALGGPVHPWLEWMPFAYKYFGANFGYGLQLSAEIGISLAIGEVHTITKIDAQTGQTTPISRP